MTAAPGGPGAVVAPGPAVGGRARGIELAVAFGAPKVAAEALPPLEYDKGTWGPDADVDRRASWGHLLRGDFAHSVLAVVVSALFHSAMSLSVKVASHEFPAAQIMWSRYGIQLLVTSVLVFGRAGVSFGTATMQMFLVCRGVMGMASQGCHVLAVKRLPLGDAVTIHTLYPVLTALLAPALLGEPLTAAAIVTAVVATLGVSLIAHGKPGHSGDSGDGTASLPLFGVLMALFSALFASLTYIIIRRIMQGNTTLVKPEVVVWAYSATAVTVLTLLLPFSAGTFVLHGVSARAWLALLAVGGTSVVEQQLVTIGFRGLPAGVGTMILTLEAGFAFLWGWTLLGEPLRWASAVGACLVGAAVVATAVRQLHQGQGRRQASPSGLPAACPSTAGVDRRGAYTKAGHRDLEKVQLADAAQRDSSRESCTDT